MLKPYNHDAASLIEACFGRKDIDVGKLEGWEKVRFVIMALVFDFFEKLRKVQDKDRLIIEVLLDYSGLDRLSKVVELLERIFIGLYVVDKQKAEKFIEIVKEWYEMMEEGRKSESYLS